MDTTITPVADVINNTFGLYLNHIGRTLDDFDPNIIEGTEVYGDPSGAAEGLPLAKVPYVEIPTGSIDGHPVTNIRFTGLTLTALQALQGKPVPATWEAPRGARTPQDILEEMGMTPASIYPMLQVQEKLAEIQKVLDGLTEEEHSALTAMATTAVSSFLTLKEQTNPNGERDWPF